MLFFVTETMNTLAVVVLFAVMVTLATANTYNRNQRSWGSRGLNNGWSSGRLTNGWNSGWNGGRLSGGLNGGYRSKILHLIIDTKF